MKEDMNYRLHRNSKDILFKYLTKLFKEKFLRTLGIEAGRVVQLLPSDLPSVQTQDLEVDFLCELEDGMLLHMEFQTAASGADIDRFMKYDALIYDEWKKPIQTYVIYGAGIKKATDTKEYGSIYYRVHHIYMEKQDGDQTFLELWDKIESGKELTEEDMGKLVLLPFMHSTKSRSDMALDSAYIASKIEDQEKQSQILAFILTMSANYLEEDQMDQIMGVMKMSKLYERLEAELLEKGYKKGIEQGIEKGIEKGIEQGIEKGIIETAIHMLKEGATIEFVRKVTNLSEERVKELYRNLH